MSRTKAPRVGTIHNGLYCIIRPDGGVTLFRDRSAAIRYLRREALERGRQTQERRREAAYLRIRQQEESRAAVRRLDGVWELMGYPLNPPGSTRDGGTPDG